MIELLAILVQLALQQQLPLALTLAEPAVVCAARVGGTGYGWWADDPPPGLTVTPIDAPSYARRPGHLGGIDLDCFEVTALTTDVRRLVLSLRRVMDVVPVRQMVIPIEIGVPL